MRLCISESMQRSKAIWKTKDKYRWSDGRKYLPGIGRGFGSDAGVDAGAGEGFMQVQIFKNRRKGIYVGF